MMTFDELLEAQRKKLQKEIDEVNKQ